MLLKTRREAKTKNEQYYDTGKSCKHGHLSKRFTHNGCCYECVQDAGHNWYHNNKADETWRKHRMLKRTRNRARLLNIPFDVTYDDIEWNVTCPVLGVVLDYTGENTQNHNAASIDKVDPSKGYVKDNVRIISMRANWLKQDATLEELEQIMRYMREHFLSKCKSC